MNKKDARREPLNAYFRQVADLMRLQAWDIEIVEGEPEDPAAIMSVDPDLRRLWAPVRVRMRNHDDFVGPVFFEEDKKEQRQDVVHELFHLVHAPGWAWIFHGSWRMQLSPREAQIVEEVYRDHMEQAVDSSARLLAPHLPLPPDWPDA